MSATVLEDEMLGAIRVYLTSEYSLEFDALADEENNPPKDATGSHPS